MKINKKFKILVDSGSIMALIKPPTKEDLTHFPLKKGKYKITMIVKKSWNDYVVKNSNYLDVKKDSTVCVSDGFYINDNPILVKTLYKRGCSISTGGDGEFTVEILISSVANIGKDPYKENLKKAKQFFKTHDFNDKNSLKFRNLFLKNEYHPDIMRILEKKRSLELKELLNEAKKILKGNK
jgi:hypothetical protein